MSRLLLSAVVRLKYRTSKTPNDDRTDTATAISRMIPTTAAVSSGPACNFIALNPSSLWRQPGSHSRNLLRMRLIADRTFVPIADRRVGAVEPAAITSHQRISVTVTDR